MTDEEENKEIEAAVALSMEEPMAVDEGSNAPMSV